MSFEMDEVIGPHAQAQTMVKCYAVHFVPVVDKPLKNLSFLETVIKCHSH